MKTTLETAPAAEPVSTAEAKTHMRIASSYTSDDTYISSLITIAREHIENVTWRKLITQTWNYYLDSFPSGGYINIPFGSLQSVSSVVYTDSDGDNTTWSSSEYIVDTGSIIGRVVLAYGYTWPNFTAYPSNPIKIQYVCGYGDTGASVPDSLLHAIKLLVADMYENREILIPNVQFANSQTFESLIQNYRIRF